MQAIKEKLHDMSVMRKAKAEARETEKAEKELAKARVDVAHEVRMAREAEAAMDYHVNKAAKKAEQHERKLGLNTANHDQQNPTSSEEAYHLQDAVDHASAATAATGGPPSNNLL